MLKKLLLFLFCSSLCFTYDGYWKTQELVKDMYFVYSLELSSNENGKIVAAWLAEDIEGTHLQASYFNGTEWLSEHTLASVQSITGHMGLLSTNINSEGNAVVTWAERLGSDIGCDVRACIFNGEKWSEIKSFYPEAVYMVDQITCSINDSGKIIVSWDVQNSDGMKIPAVAVYNSRSWSDVYNLESSYEYSVVFLNNAINNNGQAIVSWGERQESSSTESVKAAILNNGSWTISDVSQSDTYSIYDLMSIDCAINKSGVAIVVWSGNYGSGTEEYYPKLAVYNGSEWSNPYTANGIEAPEPMVMIDLLNLSLNNSDQAIISWVEYDGTSYYARATMFDGNSLDITNFNESGGASQVNELTHSLNANGNAVVSWKEYDGSKYSRVKACMYVNGSWGGIKTSNGLSDCDSITNSINDSCKAVVTWHENAEWDPGVYPGGEAEAALQSMSLDDLQLSMMKIGLGSTSYEYVKSFVFDGISWIDGSIAKGNDIFLKANAINNLGQAIVSWNHYDGTDYYAKTAIFSGGVWNVYTLGKLGYMEENSILSNTINDIGQMAVCWSPIYSSSIAPELRDAEPKKTYGVNCSITNFADVETSKINLFLQKLTQDSLEWPSLPYVDYYKVYDHNNNLMYSGTKNKCKAYRKTKGSQIYYIYCSRYGRESLLSAIKVQ